MSLFRLAAGGWGLAMCGADAPLMLTNPACLVLRSYEVTRRFPEEERFGLPVQLRRDLEI